MWTVRPRCAAGDDSQDYTDAGAGQDARQQLQAKARVGLAMLNESELATGG